jgi:hypothetical protein
MRFKFRVESKGRNRFFLTCSLFNLKFLTFGIQDIVLKFAIRFQIAD